MGLQNPGYSDGSNSHIVFASTQIGTSFSPGPNKTPAVNGPWRKQTDNAMQRVRAAIFGAAMENWMPFTAWVWSRLIPPRPPTKSFESTFDLDGGERIQRQGTYPSGERPFPYPYEIGMVSGLMPMLDQYSMQWAWGKTPSGPGVLTPIPIPWQTSYPNLRKVTG